MELLVLLVRMLVGLVSLGVLDFHLFGIVVLFYQSVSNCRFLRMFSMVLWFRYAFGSMSWCEFCSRQFRLYALVYLLSTVSLTGEAMALDELTYVVFSSIAFLFFELLTGLLELAYASLCTCCCCSFMYF